jgi:tripartite-type tricarboxylate transporter receptor subunit TctC
MPDLLAEQVRLTFAPVATVIEYVKAGRLRALAVTGARPRMKRFSCAFIRQE